MSTHIAHAETAEQIAATFDVMRQLRPHLERDSYVLLIQSLMASDGLKVLALSVDGAVGAVATYRVMNMLYCGRIIYVDDLVSDEHARSRGYGRQLIAKLRNLGRELGCSEIQLISRTTREHAHRFYFREGFGIECFHFRTKLTPSDQSL